MKLGLFNLINNPILALIKDLSALDTNTKWLNRKIIDKVLDL